MSKYQIITDSAAYLHGVTDNRLTVIPYQINIDGTIYQEGIDITRDNYLPLFKKAQHMPQLIAPSVQDFELAYRQALKKSDVIIVIVTSREITQSWQNAMTASQNIGHKNIIVLDSQSVSAGQGILVKLALKITTQPQDIDEIIRLLRGAREQIFTLYYVENMDYLHHNGIMSLSHTFLGTMLGLNPVLTIEEGHIVPIEKVKNRTQAIERLVEFIIEFTDIEELIILQSQPVITDIILQFNERLVQEFPHQQFTFVRYNPSLAVLLGTDVISVCIHENEWENDDLT
jgi:DegV family protein with EDD domain